MKKYLYSLFAILFAISAYAQPNTITYQGVLTDNGGILINGNRDITFSLFDAQTIGNLLWTETHTNVTVADGLFQVELNSINNNWSSANFAGNMWLQMTVDNTTLSPRIKFNASGYAFATAGITDVGSGRIITDEERQRWNDATPDTIRHPENDVYAGGLIASYPTTLIVSNNGVTSSEKKHVLVFEVPSNIILEQRFSYVHTLTTAQGDVTVIEPQKRLVITKVFDYENKPYEKSYRINVDIFDGETLFEHIDVSPNNPIVQVTNQHLIIVKLVSEAKVSIMLDQISQSENFETFINEIPAYFPSVFVDEFAGERTQLHINVKNQGTTKDDYIIAIRNCSQNMNMPTAPTLSLASGEEKTILVDLFFPRLLGYTGPISLWVDLQSDNGALLDSVQVFFNKTSQ